MAATVSSWEVVKGNKSKKGKNEVSTKSQKKNLMDRMPKHVVKHPLGNDRSIFDALLSNNKTKTNKAANNNTKAGNSTKSKANDNNNKKNGNAKKKKPEPETKDSRKISIEEAIAQVDKATLENILTKDQASFPDNPDVWMKDLASYLNIRFEKFPEKDPVFKDKPKDFPLGLLKSDVKRLLTSAVRRCPADVQDQMFQHSINGMLNESAKGTSTYGYRMFIQLLAREKPELVISKLPQYMDLLKSHQNRPLRCSSILWALGQAGFKDLSSGLRIWLDVMISSLGFRTITVASYPVDYLETLFSIHKNLSSAYGFISTKDYFYILDLIYNTNINIQADLRKKLKSLNSKLKVITYGPNIEKNLRSFFPSYLSRLNPNCSQAMKSELLSCLVRCLVKDVHCFSLWQQMYTKHLKQSGVLMTHLLENWHKVSSEFDKNFLHETLRSFSVTNAELAAKGTNDPCFDICRNLQQKMTQPRFHWSLLIFLFISSLASLFLIDVYKSGNVKATYTVQFLETHGVLALTEQIWGRIELYSLKAHVSLKENTSKYYNLAEKNLGPHLVLAWTKIQEFGVFIAEGTTSQRHLLYIKLLQGRDWLYNLSPETWEQLDDYFWLSLTMGKEYSIWLWQHIVHTSLQVYTYISTQISG